MLAGTDLRHGARDGKKKNGVMAVDPVPTLAEIGITKNESSEAQFLVNLTEKTFQAIKSFTMTRAQAKRVK